MNEQLFYNSGLPTRIDLLDDLDKISNSKGNHAHTLIQISIDDFADISDYFGLDIARELLSQFSSWLGDTLPTRSAKLYRYDMNKFVIYISTRSKVQFINDYIKQLFTEISNKYFYIGSNTYNITVTLGVARGKKMLFKKSYLALSEALKKDRPYIMYFHDKNIEENFLKNIQTHHDIKYALENNGVLAHYQPIYNNKSKRVEKHEVLIRLEDSDGNIKSPIEFLDVAKKVKLYSKLTKTIVELSIKELENIKKPITINLSTSDIEDSHITRFIHKLVSKINLAKLITFEIIETEQINSFLKVTNFIKKMKKLGCKFAIDDFGSGFSNFDHILKLDIDYLKIDGSLIKNIDTSKENEIFVKTIVNFAKELNIKTVAEYVYNKTIFDKVSALGVDYMQGYYIGKPKRFIA